MWKAVTIDRKTYRVPLCGRRSLRDFPQDPFSSDSRPRLDPIASREFQEAGMFSSPAHTLISEEVLEALCTSDFLRDVLVPLCSSDSCGRPGTMHGAVFPPTHWCGWLSRQLCQETVRLGCVS
uniref:Uncharacterized protein n=1 Tax=Salmo trutta TaxID=8032 RepID=A0A674CV21_SALTR